MDFNIFYNQLLKREYFHFYDENIKSYGDDFISNGLKVFQENLNKNFNFNDTRNDYDYFGEEISPFLQTGIGVKYPFIKTDKLIEISNIAFEEWKNTSLELRLTILSNSLNRVAKRFGELAFSTMHTTGQSFMMSFQASGPHCCDRALEILSQAYYELGKYPKQVKWSKNMGKFELNLNKNFKPIPYGISLSIGCSTFPTWNTIPGVFASLVTGNSVIVKPHPKAIYPIAIFIDELKNELKENNINTHVIELAIDGNNSLRTKELLEHKDVKIIDYTGGNNFGNIVESSGKICFTEKAGINSVIIESVNDIDKVIANIAFSVSLYSGQMCTAPQNIYVSKNGIKNGESIIDFDEFIEKLKSGLTNLLTNEKAAAPTLGAIQNDLTLKRINEFVSGKKIVFEEIDVKNNEFENARISTPKIIVTDSKNKDIYLQEVFGPLIIVIKTETENESLVIAKESAKKHGAITCLCYSKNENFMKKVEEEMNSVFTPVSFNFIGGIFVNQHAAFSDFHVSGGNPSGNATFTDSTFINNRYRWIGNRYML